MKDPNRRGADIARRTAVKNMALAAAAAVILPSRRTIGAELPQLDVKDPAAIALAYVLNASQVDPKKYPQYVQGSNCENCLQLQGTAGNTYRPCSLFPGKLVSVGGWCKGWTPEM
ncbi:MAG: high-potential iron-sulfur protein [Steroidobacteraceae bacterium]|jgi:hypothetical protein